MHDDPLLFVFFLIFTGAAVIGTFALYARQALIVSYIIVGVILGPSGLGWASNPDLLRSAGDVGIMFLLFLLGLDINPEKLIKLLRSTTLITGISALVFAALGASAGMLLGLTLTESLVVGAALVFSSTIIGLKLLPTTVLHHRHTGEVIISILLLQDAIAIVLMLLLQARAAEAMSVWINISILIAVLLGVSLFAYMGERFVLHRLIARFDAIQEYIFLLAIGWCLGIAELGVSVGLSREMGAFIAGVALARSPISQFIAESLKPLRDFFLIIFFFTLGAQLQLNMLLNMLVPALVLAAVLLLVKPLVFTGLLRWHGEDGGRAREIGVRLGQNSEFALLVAVLAYGNGVIREQASYLIQLTTVITMVVSMYLIVWRYPTPIAVRDDLRRG
jgi:Kef-type K+ transport system membrane component KefB